jgi:hypothetical protein
LGCFAPPTAPPTASPTLKGTLFGRLPGAKKTAFLGRFFGILVGIGVAVFPLFYAVFGVLCVPFGDNYSFMGFCGLFALKNYRQIILSCAFCFFGKNINYCFSSIFPSEIRT